MLEQDLLKKREAIGAMIKVNKSAFREEIHSRIIDVVIIPSAHPTRLRWIEFYEQSLSYEKALAQTKEYYGHEPLELRITYISEAKSSQEYSSHLNMMLLEEEFIFS